MMKLTEILGRFRQGKSTARSHIKNLIEIAASDGNFDDVEYHLLQQIAKRNGISNGKLKEIHANPEHVEFEIPYDRQEKFHQMYDLVHMMVVDNEVHPEEMKLCNLFALRFGYPKQSVDELITTIRGNIENGNGHNDTMKRIEWMLN